jgi:hypothetical protein
MKRLWILGAALAVPLAACTSPTGGSRDPRPNVTDACEGNVQPLTLAVGGHTSFWGGSAGAVCIGGGAAGAEYAIVASHGNTTGTQQLAISAKATGVVPPTVALGTLLGPEAARVPALADAHARLPHDGGFHERLRRIEREELTARMPAARMEMRASGPETRTLSTVPAVGTLMSFNVNSQQACTNPDTRTGRVAHISQTAVFVADTANPAGGFTAADLQTIGAAIDTLITPVVVGAFGQPSDIDQNQRIVVFYTRAVNELTPRNAQFVIGGFFFARDLYPRVGAQPCATSNEAEMFYMLAPDPNGTVNGHVRTREYVLRNTRSTLAHEYQHLINSSRRLYVTNAASFETIWLDEGLAHIAEELVFFRAAGLGPRQNITAPMIQSSQQRVDAFNEYQTANIGRLDLYVRAPERNSPWMNNDSLPTRGATYHLLRYAADQRGGDEAQAWRSLAAGPATGTANLANVFGSDLERLHANWSTSVLVDDVVANIAPAISFPSWHMRSIFQALSRQYQPPVRTLAHDAPVETTLAGGGTAYFRMGVAPGESASLLVTRQANTQALPGSFGVTIVRTR